MPARRALVAIAVAGVANTILRLHFIGVPLNTDEGGYAAVARLWSQGYRLYGPVAWVDRPQGLVVAYRAAVTLGGSDTVRWMAVAASALTLIAVAAAGWAVAGQAAAIVAAWLYAILSAAPHLEGFTANGELLSEALAAAAVALAAWALRSRHASLWVAAGLAAGVAPLIKQSALDGLVVVIVAVGLSWRPRTRVALLAASGMLAAPLVAVAHAAATGLDAWWYAVFSYRASTESLLAGSVSGRLRLLAGVVPSALADLAPLLVFFAVGLYAARRQRRAALLVAWLVAAVAGFLGGGLFHPHYWIGLVAVLAVCAGVGVVGLYGRSPRLVLLLAGASLVPVVAYNAEVYATRSAARVSLLTSSDSRLLSARAVGRQLAALAPPRRSVYVVWANAVVYWYANRPPALRYLWYLNVQHIPGAVQQARRVMNGPDPPAAVAVYQPPGWLDTTGLVSRVLARRYRLVTIIDGVDVYRLAA